MDLSLSSQDILATQIPFFRKDESPTKGCLLQEWKCVDAASYGFRAWDDFSNGSNQLPSLGVSDNVSDLLQLSHLTFPVSDLQTTEGLHDLTCISIGYIHHLKEMTSNPPIKDFLHVITIFEYIGLSGELNEDQLCCLDNCIKRLLMKVSSITLSEVTLKKCAIKNPFLHAYIFTWRAAYRIYTANRSLSTNTCSRRSGLLDNLLTTTAAKLIKIYENYRSIAPCSCIQSFIFLLFGDKEKKFEENFMKCFESIRLNSQNQLVDKSFLRINELPSAISMFSYYVKLTEYLLNVQRLRKDSNWTSGFLFRIFGMAEKLVSVDLLQICEILVSFLDKNELGSLTRSKMFSKKFWTEIVRYLESRPIRELETTALESPTNWASLILTMDTSQNPEICLLRLLVKLMADRSVWENTRILIKNHFAGKKISFNPNTSATMLSLLMCLCTNESVGRELMEHGNLPIWLVDAIEVGNPTVQQIVFNANRALAKICGEQSLWYPQDEILYSLLNKLPLPASNNLFLDVLTSLVPYRKITGIDFGRAEILSEPDFCRFVAHFVDADWSLPHKIWLRANSLVDARKGGAVTKNFVANQFRAGLQENIPFFTARLNSLIEKYGKDPWRIEVLQFCNKILEPGRTYNLNLDLFVPLWIASVIGFEKSDEFEVKTLTRSVWEGLCQIFERNGCVDQSVDANIELDDSKSYIFKMFQALHSIPNKQWAIQKLALWFPPNLSQSLQLLIKRKDTNMEIENRRTSAITIISSLLEFCAPLLYTLSEMNESKQPFNGSTLVVIVCAVTDRDILQRRYHVLDQHIVGIVSGLSKIPETSKRSLFIRSRLKDILLAFSQDPIGHQLARIIAEQQNYAGQLQKENPQIKSLFADTV